MGSLSSCWFRSGYQESEKGLCVAKRQSSTGETCRRPRPQVARTSGCFRSRKALVSLRAGRAQAPVDLATRCTTAKLRTVPRLSARTQLKPRLLCGLLQPSLLSPVVPRHFPSWIPSLVQSPLNCFAIFPDSLLLGTLLLPLSPPRPSPRPFSRQAPPLRSPCHRPRAPSGVCACSLSPTAKSSKGTF